VNKVKDFRLVNTRVKSEGGINLTK